jgi:hypothetical protein
MIKTQHLYVVPFTNLATANIISSLDNYHDVAIVRNKSSLDDSTYHFFKNSPFECR